MATYTKLGAGIAGFHGLTPTKAGYAASGLAGSGIGLLNADVFLKTGAAKAGLGARGDLAGLFNRSGYAVLAGSASGSALIASEFLTPALEHDLVLTPESADSFSLTPSAPGAFALTPLEEEDFVLYSHPDLDSG